MLPDRFREVFAYEPETGILTRKVATAPMHKVGERVGYKHKGHGYIALAVDYKSHLAHRVIWAIVHGKMPEGEIDHINGDKTDNRLCNLRDVSKQLNQLNRPKGARRDNTSGHTGVFKRDNGKFRAMLGGAKARQHLGTYDTFAEAAAARDAALARIWRQTGVEA